MPSIFIGVPNQGSVGTSLSYRLRQWCLSGKYDITVVEATRYRPLELAVNTLLKEFLATDCEYLFLINDDEHLPENALDRLLAHDKDVVIPLGYRWGGDQGPLPCVGVRDGGTDLDIELARHFEQPRDIDVIPYEPLYIQPMAGYVGLRQCDRVGNSGILIKRHVMEAIPLGTFRMSMTEDRTDVIATEDYVWCDAIRAAGFEIWVDCDMVLDHFKTVNLKVVRMLMVHHRREGQNSAIRALKRMRASGATDTEAIDGLFEWLEERREDVS